MALDLGTSTASEGTKVGTATEICNSTTGYTVSIASANAVTTQAKLKTAAGDTLDYSISYNDVTLNLVNKVCVIAFTTDAETDADGTDHDIKVIYTTKWLPAGTYEDTLTLTITAK